MPCCLPAVQLLNNLEGPLTPGPAVQGSHGNLSCPAEEKNKIPGFELSHLWPTDSFALPFTLSTVCTGLTGVCDCPRLVHIMGIL